MDDSVAWRLSDIASGMERSRILSIAASVRAMIADGEAVAPFTVGDFSPSQFEVPRHLTEAIVESVLEGETNYPPAAGLPELRDSLSNWMSVRYGVDVGSEGIIVGSGARPVLYAAFRLFLESGDGLAVSGADATIAIVEVESHEEEDGEEHDEDEHENALHVIGVSTGSTSFQLQLMHDGHADYTSTNNVSVTVQ